MGGPLNATCCFSLLLLIFFSLLLIFYRFDYCVSLCVPPWVYPAWDSLCFLDWVTISFPTLGKFSANYLFKCFLPSSLSLSSFLDPYNMNIGVVNVPKVSSVLLISYHFFLYSVSWQWFSLFCPPVHFCNLLCHLFCYRFSLVHFKICYFIAHLLFFSSSRSLLSNSFIFWNCTSIVLPRFWIIFTTIILNSFSDRLPVSTSLGYSSGVLSFSLISDIFLCHLTFSDCNIHSLGCRVVVLVSALCPMVDAAV